MRILRSLRFAGALIAVVPFLLMGCNRGGGASPRVALRDVFPQLRFDQPLAALQAPSDAGRWYIVEKGGRVLLANNGANTAAVFIDIRDRVDASHGESGLLGMAFHPNFNVNRLVFLSYTRTGAPLVSYVSRFTANASGTAADPGSEQVLLTLNQPFSNHNGGNIAFGPDGNLYIGFGDGGSGGDPMNNAQNTTVLLGKILRVDVNQGAPYAIPADNPFASGAGGNRREIYAWGLRNPWRFSFDRGTGQLWAGDVGQNAFEEIDRIERGGNYGWNIREGKHCFQAATCNTAGLIDPVVEYGRSDGASVTGGYVYRGAALPSLQGAYLYADFVSGRIWGLFNDQPLPQVLLESRLNIASFAEDVDGELYVLSFSNGKMYRILPGN